jgi:hypothetical protein
MHNSPKRIAFFATILNLCTVLTDNHLTPSFYAQSLRVSLLFGPAKAKGTKIESMAGRYTFLWRNALKTQKQKMVQQLKQKWELA